MSRGEGERGVTLLELLVVIAILSLLATAALRLPLGVRGSVTLTREAAALEAAVAEARRAALAAGRVVTMRLDVEDGCYGVVEKPCRPLPSDVALSVRAVAGLSSDPGTAGVRFFPDGSSTGAVIALTTSERAWELVVPWTTGRGTTGRGTAS